MSESDLSWDEAEELENAVREDEGDPESCIEGGWNASEHCQRCPTKDFCLEGYLNMIKAIKG